jgi:hypothetical protein
MSPLETLVVKLKASGLEVTPAEAEAIAVHCSGSVDAYLTMLAGHEKDLAELIEPAPGPVSTKWSDPVAYDIKFPADE